MSKIYTHVFSLFLLLLSGCFVDRGGSCPVVPGDGSICCQASDCQARECFEATCGSDYQCAYRELSTPECVCPVVPGDGLACCAASDCPERDCFESICGSDHQCAYREMTELECCTSNDCPSQLCVEASCVEHACVYEKPEGSNCCVTVEDCVPNGCHEERCINNRCEYIRPEETECCSADDCPDQPCFEKSCTNNACEYTSPEGTECCLTSNDCNDDDACTLDQCTNNQCIHRNVPVPEEGCCVQNFDCFIDECHRASVCGEDHRCIYAQSDNCCIATDEDPTGVSMCGAPDNACMEVSCDLERNRCVQTPREDCCLNDGQCDDENDCTRDQCIGNECLNTAVSADEIPGCCLATFECQDGNECTRNRCLSNHCYTEELGIEAGCCDNDEECDDANPCTNDVCVDGMCQYELLAVGEEIQVDEEATTCCSTNGDCPIANRDALREECGSIACNLPQNGEVGFCRQYSWGDSICRTDNDLDGYPDTAEQQADGCILLNMHGNGALNLFNAQPRCAEERQTIREPLTNAQGEPVFDCRPTDPLAFPGQALWFPTQSPQGNLIGTGMEIIQGQPLSYDYDCDGTSEYELGTNIITGETCTLQPINGNPCPSGWVRSIPNCGEEGLYRHCFMDRTGQCHQVNATGNGSSRDVPTLARCH